MSAAGPSLLAAARGAAMHHQHLGDLEADGRAWVQRGEASWLTSAIPSPHRRRRLRRDRSSTSRAGLAGDVGQRGNRPMRACTIVDLPEPDSPITAKISPRAISKLTPRTAGPGRCATGTSRSSRAPTTTARHRYAQPALSRNSHLAILIAARSRFSPNCASQAKFFEKP